MYNLRFKIDVKKIVYISKKADMSTEPYYQISAIITINKKRINYYTGFLAREIGGNLIVEKNVTTKGCQRRLTIYNKELELQRACNRKFLEMVEDCDRLLDYFNDKTRFELNLNSKEQLRKALNILDTSIGSVLNSDANPIWQMLDKALVKVSDAGVCHSLNELKNLLLLKYCNQDLVKVGALLRQHLPPPRRTSVK